MFKPEQARFTGHQTFTFRYSWAPKVHECLADGSSKRIFSEESAIATFGVGKNMVSAIQHWTHAAGLIELGLGPHEWRMTAFGSKILGELDPWMERQPTPWLLHWQLARSPVTASIYWLFNVLPDIEFRLDAAAEELLLYANSLSEGKRKDKSLTTFRRDLDCVLRAYMSRKKTIAGDDLDSPLAELQLSTIYPARKQFAFLRDDRDMLPDEVFVYALLEYWADAYPGSSSLTFENALYNEESPGMVFRMSEAGLTRRAESVEKLTKRKIVWSETAGLRQWTRIKSGDLRLQLEKVY